MKKISDIKDDVLESVHKMSYLNIFIVIILVVLILHMLYLIYNKCSSSTSSVSTALTSSDATLPENENFEDTKEKTPAQVTKTVTIPTDYVESDREITINPPYKNVDTRTIMAGSGFVPQKDIIPAWGPNYNLVDGLDDGAGGDAGLLYNLTSPACCSAQYPTPHKMKVDPLVCGNTNEFVASPFTGNNSWQNAGCSCVTKDQVQFLTDRGGNSPSFNYA